MRDKNEEAKKQFFQLVEMKKELVQNIPRYLFPRQEEGKELTEEEKRPLVERIQKALFDAEKKYETTTLSKEQEKKLLSDINQLKKAIPSAEKLAPIEPKIQALKLQREDLRA